jgi:hypothetical protein
MVLICCLLLLTLVYQFVPYGVGKMLGQPLTAWWMLLIIISLFGVYSAPVKLLIFGFIASFNEAETNFTSLFMLGTASNGIAVIVIKIIVLTTMDSENVVQTSFVFTITVAAIITMCLILFINMLKYPIVDEKFNPENYKVKEKKPQDMQASFKAALRKKISLKYSDLRMQMTGAVIVLSSKKDS